MPTTTTPKADAGYHATIAENNETKEFTLQQFESVVKSHFFMGAVSFWRELERLAQPEETIRIHARGILGTLAEREYRNCCGFALSPQHAEALTFCGLTPLDVRSSGSLAKEADMIEGRRRW